MWVLTRPMRQDESAEVFEFQESSNYSVLQGKIIVSEQKK